MSDELKKFINRYRFFFLSAVLFAAFAALFPQLGKSALGHISDSAIEMISIIPPIFVLLGLLDVWVNKETMIKLMGEKSGMLGILLAFFLGSAAAGPLYAAFPVAAVLLKKGSKLSNVLIFIGAWSTTKLPMLLFEFSAMSWKFALTRFLLDILGIALIAVATERLLSKDDIRLIMENAAKD